ncbi:MAG: Hsp20/alpha crystallin family protein [Candidatus Hodarchaeales archaeon]|jgi:HSP20 family protein
MFNDDENNKNDRKNFFNNFFESFDQFFSSFEFPQFEWMNDPEIQKKLKEEGRAFWGYSSFVGPDGKPVVKTWGNTNPTKGFNLSGESQGIALDSGSDTEKYREPFIDIIEENDHFKILAELPGVKKEDINLKAKKDGLKLSAGNFDKFIPLNVEIDPKSIKANYNNGVLEIRITIANKETKDDGFTVKVN